jgi:hypothetical protein
MYHAKQAGRNCVAFAPPLRDMGVGDIGRSGTGDKVDAAAGLGSAPVSAGGTPLAGHHVVLVQADSAGASLCPPK